MIFFEEIHSTDKRDDGITTNLLKLGNVFDVKTFSDKVNLEFERIFSF